MSSPGNCQKSSIHKDSAGMASTEVIQGSEALPNSLYTMSCPVYRPATSGRKLYRLSVPLGIVAVAPLGASIITQLYSLMRAPDGS